MGQVTLLAHHRSRGPAVAFFDHSGGGGVHEVVAHDVVLDRDPGVGVSEEFGGEVDASGVVDRGGSGAAEAVRGDAGQAGLLHHVAKAAADVVRRQRASATVAEQQRIWVDREPLPQPRFDRLHRERG